MLARQRVIALLPLHCRLVCATSAHRHGAVTSPEVQEPVIRIARSRCSYDLSNNHGKLIQRQRRTFCGGCAISSMMESATLRRDIEYCRQSQAPHCRACKFRRNSRINRVEIRSVRSHSCAFKQDGTVTSDDRATSPSTSSLCSRTLMLAHCLNLAPH
jgi:hypothetical protein